MEDLLNEREKRQQTIRDVFSDTFVVVVKANIPGLNKNLGIANLLVYEFVWAIKHLFSIKEYQVFSGLDGPWALLRGEGHPQVWKQQLIQLECEHVLGKYIDCDVYDQHRKQISRQDLQYEPRKCWLCEKDAHYCARNQTHTIEELLHVMMEELKTYYSVVVSSLALQSGLEELHIDHKFGLVTQNSNGSHPDMNYELMKKSLVSLLPYFEQIFSLGFSEFDFLDEAMTLGQKAEENMLLSTNQVNTYKGLIYVLGISVYALGNCIYRGCSDLFLRIGEIGKAVNEMQKQMKLALSFGIHAASYYQISGIRGEVASGLKNVKKRYWKLHDFSEDHLRLLLVDLISEVDDTVLLKRAKSKERYEEIKSLFHNLDKNNTNWEMLTQTCVDEQLSFGGSADLLIVILFLKHFYDRYPLGFFTK